MSAADLFWGLAAELRAEEPRIVEGTIMNGRCLRVGKEFLALVDYKGSGLVVKLPKARVEELIRDGKGRPFGPAGRVFKEWLSVPTEDPGLWRALCSRGSPSSVGDLGSRYLAIVRGGLSAASAATLCGTASCREHGLVWRPPVRATHEGTMTQARQLTDAVSSITLPSKSR